MKRFISAFLALIMCVLALNLTSIVTVSGANVDKTTVITESRITGTASRM